MREWVKISSVVVLFAVFGSDLGTRISEEFHHSIHPANESPRIKIEQEAKGPPADQGKPHEQASTQPPAFTENGGARPDRNETSQEGTEFLPRFLGFKLKVTDTLLVIFTFCLAGSTCLLWFETKAIARATKDALILAEQAFVFEQSVRASGIIGPDGIITRWEFMMCWKNMGTTPARHVLMHASTIMCGDSIPDSFDFPDQLDPDEAADDNIFTLGPGQEKMSNPQTYSHR